MSGYSRRVETTSGRLRTRITIQSAQRTDDGTGGYVMTWGGSGHSWPAWAEKLYASGGDAFELEQLQGRRQFRYRIRRRRDVIVTSAMRVLDGLSTLAITSVCADDEDRTSQTLHCTESITTAPPALVVTPGAIDLPAAFTQQLSAVAYDNSGTLISNPPVVWTSGDTSVATVSSTGLVTAVANGSCNISATYNGLAGTCAVLVQSVFFGP